MSATNSAASQTCGLSVDESLLKRKKFQGQQIWNLGYDARVNRRLLALSLGVVVASVTQAQTRSHPYDLIYVDWHVVLNTNNGSLTGDVTNTLKPNKGVTEVWLDRGNLTITQAMVDGKVAKFRLDGEKVFVTLPANKRGGQPVKVRVRYNGTPEAGLYFVPAERAFPAKTPVIYTQGEMEDNRFWLVTYDYPDDKATSQGTIDVPKGYTTYSNGKMIGQTESAGRSVWKWKMDKAHATYLISLVAGPYDTGKESWGGIDVQFGVPAGLMEMGQTSFGGTADMIRFYSEITGFKYPYPKFTQEAVPDYMFGGMENITAVTQTINSLHPKSVDDINSSKGLVLHELAHQWFGDTVTTDGWGDAWINEGWATFMPSFYVRETEGQEAYDLSRYGTFQGGLGAHHGRKDRGVVYHDYKDPLDMFDGFIYAGGASRMFMLMHQLGEAKFWASCKQYLNERKFTSFDTKDFFKTWSKASGTDLAGFMNQWFYTPAAPNLTLKWDGDDVLITQPEPYFDLQVPVSVLTGSTWSTQTAHLTNGSVRLTFKGLGGKPFLGDPETWIMGDFNYPSDWNTSQKVALYNYAPNAATKAKLMDTFLRNLSPEEKLTFAKTITSKALLARYMGSLAKTDGLDEFLLEKTHDTDRPVANAAIGQLRSAGNGDAVTARLKEVLDNDPNDLIRQTAARVLLGKTQDAALADRLWAMNSYNDGFRSIALDYWFESDKDAARIKCLEILANPPSEPVRVQAIGDLGRLKDVAGSRVVFNALASIVADERSFGARSTAIRAMGSYGDKAAIPIIKPLLKSELVFFRQAAAGVTAQLGG